MPVLGLGVRRAVFHHLAKIGGIVALICVGDHHGNRELGNRLDVPLSNHAARSGLIWVESLRAGRACAGREEKTHAKGKEQRCADSHDSPFSSICW